ncbi:MAG: carbohydrate ABC transporter permease [Clostridiales bacterium]|nr:carbohydrate ABC transporter permease [Clostridiales bacterium]
MAYRGRHINPQRFERGQIKILLILLPLALFMALPIVFIINHAFKPMEELFAFPPTFFVRNPTLDNFTKLLKFSRSAGIPLTRYLFNSLLVTVLTVGLSLFTTTCAAFAFSKIKFRGRSMMLQINQIAIMFVATAVLIPRYLVISGLGLIDTILAHVLPLAAMPVALFLVKQFVDQVPDSLIEAAHLDGASDFQVYWRIILPVIKPAIATAMVLVFQQVWTNLETSSYFTNDESMKTLTFYMNTLVNSSNGVAGQGVAAAASLIMFIPNLILFIICQNAVMNTMATSGIK